jgi:CHRD domain
VNVRNLLLATSLVAVVAAAVGGFAVARGDGKSHFKTRLDGWQEDPSQVTTGFGRFRARVIDEDTIEFWLRYSDLEGDASQAHIHIGSHHESGGVSAWLCGAGGTAQPACPPREGEVHWFIEPDDITGPLDQGVEPGNMEDFLRAMRHDEAYVNVHTLERAPRGEIRGDFGHDRRH